MREDYEKRDEEERKPSTESDCLLLVLRFKYPIQWYDDDDDAGDDD